MRIKVAVIVVVAVVLAFVLWWAVSTHGWGWAIHQITYKLMISSLPEPHGWIPDTEWMHSGPDFPSAERRYEVIGKHNDVVEFFKTALPEKGWSYVGEWLNPSDPANNDHVEILTLLYDDPRNLCLEVAIRSTIQTSENTVETPVRVELSLVKIRHDRSRIDSCEDFDIAR